MGGGASKGVAAAVQAVSDDDLKAAMAGLSDADRKKLFGALGVGSGCTKSGPAKGKGGLDTVVLRHTCGSSAEIYLFGATLCSYKTPDGKERIFVSPGAIFDGKKAIRGGVPVVFPQFGQPDEAMAQHGFARNSLWAVKTVEDSAEKTRAIFTLSDSDATREKWPNPFALEFEVTLTEGSLQMALRITNTGDASFSFHTLLHTYFAIPDIAETYVQGLNGLSYVDKVAGGETKKENEPKIVFPSFTDRVYIGNEAEAKHVTIAQKGGGTLFVVKNEARIEGEVKPCDVVVWNPYEEASPGDLPPPAFKNFVCVEPGLVSKMSELPPKASAELSQIILPH